jgi:CelD/BcsL family acetyltransferase involved in cellulose biosynthesis
MPADAHEQTCGTGETLIGTADLELSHATPEHASDWDEFVNRHPEGRFCHLWGYQRVLGEAYGYKCVYLNLHHLKKRVGVFPSVVVSRGIGRLVSQPFNEYGGPLTRDLSVEQQKALPALLMQVALEEGCRSVEIRGGIGCEAMSETDLCCRSPLHRYAVLNLGDRDQLWRRSLNNEARKGVNRARQAGLKGQIRRGSDAVEDPFYALYLSSMKRLGVPPHSQRFFAKLAEELANHVVAAWVTHEGTPVGVLLGIVTGQRIHALVTASDHRAWSMRPNDFAHWELIEWAILAGLRVFDFGSVRYPGQQHFKMKWGSSLQNYNRYYIREPQYVSLQQVESIDSSGRFATVMSSLWRGMMPTILTPVLGPPIRRYLTK